MSTVNKVILVGNLGKDPETRTFPSGDSVCNVTIATSEKWKDKQSGEAREHTEWHRLTFNGRLAEVAAQYLRKGAKIYVEGSIRTRKYNDKDGVEKYATDIRVDQMQMLSARQDDGGDQGGRDGGRGENRSTHGADERSQQGSQQRNSYGDARGRAPAPAPSRAPAPAKSGGGSGFDDMDDDIPF